MFDWFWNFLYSLTKGLLWICDRLLQVANVLIGIDPIKVDGEETNLIQYLVQNDTVHFTFAACFSIAMILLVIFTIFQILKTISKEGEGMPPSQICMKSFKAFMTFLFVPVIMIVLVEFMTLFMQALWSATSMGSSSLGQYMFCAFADCADCWIDGNSASSFIAANADYYSTSTVRNYVDLNDYAFLYSWLVGGVVVVNLSASLLMFVDRAISIVILYCLAPFPIAASVIDEGSRFKSWREQILNKFLAGFGVLIAINFYIMVMSLVCSSKVQLFSSSILNTVGKIMIILGGALTTKKAGALIGSMVSASGGNEVNDPAFRGNAFGAALGKAVGGVVGGVAGIANAGRDIKNYGFKGAVGRGLSNIASSMGFKTDRDYAKQKKEDEELFGNGNKNDKDPNYNGGDQNGLKDALENGNNEKSEDNTNDKDTEKGGKGNDMMNNAINNDNNENKDEKKDDQ